MAGLSAGVVLRRRHESAGEYDAARTRWLEQAGYRVIRFTNDQALCETEGVLLEIRSALGQAAEW